MKQSDTPPLSKLSKLPRGKIVLAFDPGHTTGVAVMVDGVLRHSGQLETGPEALMNGDAFRILSATLDQAFRVGGGGDRSYAKGLLVAIEDYRVYSGKLHEHEWAELHTAKLIGVLLAVCQASLIPVVMAMASEAKGFVTDEKLEAWGLWVKGQKHARDAIRHAVLHTVKGLKK